MRKVLVSAISAAILSTPVYAESGVYLFGDLGISEVDMGTPLSGLTYDDSDTTTSLGIGYSLTDNFALEVGYVDLGEAKISTSGAVSGSYLGTPFTASGTATLGVDATGYIFGAKAHGEITEKLNAFVRGGFYNWESDLSFSVAGTVNGTPVAAGASTKLDDGTDLYAGAGLSYELTDSVELNAQWVRYMLELEGQDSDVDTYTIGLAFKF